MNTDSHPRYALITGGGSGLGQAFCLQLASAGWHVAVADINLAAAEETLRLIHEAGGHGQVEALNVSDHGAWQHLQKKLRQSWPQLDLLINNAGVCSAGDMGTAPLEDFQHVLKINLQGVLQGCHCMVPWMKESTPGGHIVNISSIFGVVSPPAMTAYCASKAAVIALSESLYGELRPLGIGVTVVLPGFFRTALVHHGKFDDDAQQKIAESHTCQASLTAEEVVNKTLAAVQRQQLYVVCGWKARWYWRLKRLFPTTVTKIAACRQRQQMQKHSAGD